jgi:chromodomain-helicase-DNA-binding protein 7
LTYCGSPCEQVDLQQKKWSRREEVNFLRTILAYGVEYNKQEQRYNWDR